ncbi:MAG: DUF748 domain-containing protein [Rhodocyclales bacterium]|nr:DUF748 domain-containing protein [Rhodocyclales bacterium]
MNTATETAAPPPPPARKRRWLLWMLVAPALLVVAAVVGLRLATDKLKTTIEAALGPNSEVASIEAGFSSIAINGIRIRAGKEWPAADELSAKRVVIRPDWDALLSRNIRIAAIEVEDGYVSMLRRKDGRLLLLPSLLARDKERDKEKAKSGADEALPEITIGGVSLSNAAVDFFDASVRQPAHKLRLEQTAIRLGQLRLPALTGRTAIELDGVVKGVRRDGKVSLKGWAEIASKDSEMQAKLAAVDLVAFQPYLIKAAETGVKKGSLDLDLKSTVKKNRLHAPGKVVLSGLELTSGKTFMGMPRDTVVKVLKDKDGRIVAEFSLDGDIDDPKFSLNEKFMSQVGIASANVLGISLEGLASGIGSVGSSAVEGIGSAVGKLFGDKK